MALERFVSRRALGWPSTSAARATTNLGMIAHYDAGFRLRNLIRDKGGHQGCIEYWKGVRSMHRNQGWLDVGYAYFACPHDYIFAGREVNHQQAAEAPTPGKLQGGNSRYVACTFGLGPGEKPTEGALRAWARLREWLMDVHGLKSAVYGHRDFTATSCPGDDVYRLVRSGALKRKPSEASKPIPKPEAKPAPPVQEEDVIGYASFGASEQGPTECQPNQWVDVLFDTEWSDPTKVHPDEGANPSILKGEPTLYWLEFGADVEGVQVGDVIDVDTAEYVYDNKATPPVDRLMESGKLSPNVMTDSYRLHFAAVGNLRKGGKLRVRVRSHAASPVKVTNARVSVAFVE